MMTPVHILVTVRRPDLLEAATLVFRTIRTGFPRARLHIHGNALGPEFAALIARMAACVEARFHDLPQTSHDEWLECLINSSPGPFWICDTDMVFHRPVPAERRRILFTGRHEPEFAEEWTGTRHMERLHTCLLWMDAPALREAIRRWQARIPEPQAHTARFDLVRQHFVPLLHPGRAAETLFYDTAAGLWHALGDQAEPLSVEQDAAFDHLHCGTYVDKVTAPSLAGLREVHAAVYADLSKAALLRQTQEEYYRRHATIPL